MLSPKLLAEKSCKKIVDIAVAEASRLSKKLGYKVDVELTVTSTSIATSRFANNEMTQNQAPTRSHLAARVIAKGRQARLTAEDFSDDDVRALVLNALEASQLLALDENLPPLYNPKTAKSESSKSNIKGSQRYDVATATTSAADRARAVASVIALAEGADASAAGIYATGEWALAVGNSLGLFEYYAETVCEYSVTMLKNDSTSWAKAQCPKVSDIDVKALAQGALDRALLAQSPGEISPGKYIAILEPAAVLDLLAYLWWDFAGTAHSDKLSSLTDKMDSKIFGEEINITDDVYHPLSSGAPFDGEGVPRQKVVLVENGVLKNLVHGRRSAAKFETAATGHGFPEPAPMGECPLNLIFECRSSDKAKKLATSAEMIVSLAPGQEAVLLTRVWYVREVDPSTKLLTGMTRDGTFLVRDGKTVKALKNLRFNISLIDLLSSVLAYGDAVVTAGEEGFPPALIPPLMVADFNFTEVTKF